MKRVGYGPDIKEENKKGSQGPELENKKGHPAFVINLQERRKPPTWGTGKQSHPKELLYFVS